MKDKSDNREYITTTEAAHLLGRMVSPRTISRWAKAGRIPAVRTPGGQYRLRRDSFASKALHRGDEGDTINTDRTGEKVSDYRTESEIAELSDNLALDREHSGQKMGGGTGMIIIAVSNPNKGGVGKTTTAISLGAALAQMGFSTLLIDLDKQTHETKWLGVRTKGARTIYHLFDVCISALHDGDKLGSEVATRLGLDEAVVKCENFYLIPGSTRSGDIESALAGIQGGERILSFILREFDENFDFCIIDCPPQAEHLNEAALVAADYVLVPLRIGLLDLDGVAMTMRQVDNVATSLNPNLKVLGILPTFFVERSQLKSAVMEEAHKNQLIAPHLMKTVVPQSTIYGQLPGMQASPFAAGRSETVRRAANTYVEVAGEVLLRTGLFTKAQVREMVAQTLVRPQSEEVANVH